LSDESGYSRLPGAFSGGHFGAPAGLDRELLQMARDGKLAGLRSTRRDLVQDWLDTGLTAEETCKRLSAYNRSVIQAVLEAHAQEHPWLRHCTFLESARTRTTGCSWATGLSRTISTTWPSPSWWLWTERASPCAMAGS
jgi:hypothetical protein